MPDQAPQSPETDNVNDALLQIAIERLKARGDAVKRFECMQLPAGIFNELCRRLIDRTQTISDTAEWLAGETPEAPTRSSVYRFADALFQEYRLVQYSSRRQLAESYVANLAEGNADAQVMALNARVTELLTDAFMQAEDAKSMDPKLLMALLMGTRSVAQTAFDKEKKDARIKALEKLNEERERAIALKDADLELKNQKIEAVKAAVVAAAKAASENSKSGGGAEVVVQKVREILGIQ